MKIITISGSMRFEKEIGILHRRLVQEGHCVLGLAPSDGTGTCTPAEKAFFIKDHEKKTELSDAIFVVNIGGYIGESVRYEIEYAKQRGKEIIYLEQGGES